MIDKKEALRLINEYVKPNNICDNLYECLDHYIFNIIPIGHDKNDVIYDSSFKLNKNNGRISVYNPLDDKLAGILRKIK